MKALSIIAAFAVVSVAVVPTFASEEENIHGRSEFAVESALREQGVIATEVEEWGDYVRAWVSNGNGGSAMQFFDADSLQPVVPFSA